MLQAQLLHELDDPLPEILAGRAKPASAAQAADLARRCGCVQKRYAAAVRLYIDAFAADARLMEDYAIGDRYDAARWAVLAASGQGRDAAALGQPERARLRRQALTWLRADLDHWMECLGQGKLSWPTPKIYGWRHDSDLASVRDKQALAALPETERRRWEQLWADVAALLDRDQKAK